MSNYHSDKTSDDQPQLSGGRLKGFLSRRSLLNSAIFGGTAAALVLSMPERNEAEISNQTQVIDNKTSTDVEKFLTGIDKMPSLSNYDQGLFINAANLINSVVEKDPNARSSYDALHAYIAQPLIKLESEYKTTSLGLPQEVINTIDVIYLRAIEILRSSTLSKEIVLTKLSNPKAVFDSFEEDFITSLSNAVEARVQSDTSFSYTLSEATEQILSIEKNISLLQESSYADRAVKCSIFGFSAPLWACVVGIIIIIIIFL